MAPTLRKCRWIDTRLSLRVLLRVLLLNLAVALAKIALGLATGAVSVLSDGFHSLTDGASNVVALVGVRIARQPPDSDRPSRPSQVRGRKSALEIGILLFLLLVLVQVLGGAFERLSAPVCAHGKRTELRGDGPDGPGQRLLW